MIIIEKYIIICVLFYRGGESVYNFKINKNIGALVLAGTIAVTSVGCGEKQEQKPTIVEVMQETQDFNLLQDENKFIITTVDAMGKEEVKFVHRERLDNLINSNRRNNYSSSEEYRKYHKNGYYADNIYLYFDAFEGDLISVEYIKRDNHVFKESEFDISYMISQITDRNYAYNYAVLYYGDQDSYSRNEMQELIPMIIEDKQIKKIGSK